MRFLLKKASSVPAKLTSLAKGQKESVRTWGQHCSPNCACVLRFETTLDPNNHNRILSASYDAKKVVVTKSNDGEAANLRPVLTQKSGTVGKPMLKQCQCSTIHKLAKTVTEVLPGLTLNQAKNQMEFTGNRSSPAFRYTVLSKNDLLPKKNADETDSLQDLSNPPQGKCFDLVEEALTACLSGYLPKPRKSVDSFARISPQNNQQTYRIKPDEYSNDDTGEESTNKSGLDPLRFVNAAKRRAKSSALMKSYFNTSYSPPPQPSPGSMPPFHMASDDLDYYGTNDTLAELNFEFQSMKEKEDTEDMSWMTYVDENLENNQP